MGTAEDISGHGARPRGRWSFAGALAGIHHDYTRPGLKPKLTTMVPMAIEYDVPLPSARENLTLKTAERIIFPILGV